MAQGEAWYRDRRLIAVAVAVVAGLLLLGSWYTNSSRGRREAQLDEAVSAATQAPKQGDPNEVAAPGEPLGIVSTPPERTRTRFAPKKDLGGATYPVEFEVYGRSSAGDLVIRVSKATAEGGNENSRDFAGSLKGQNLLASVDSSTSAPPTKGGTYSATLILVPSNPGFTFSLSNVRAVR